MLGHPRYLEFFEAAFIECWRDRFGSLDESLGPERRLTVVAVNVRYVAPVRADDELRVEVLLDRITERSIEVHYDPSSKKLGSPRPARATSASIRSVKARAAFRIESPVDN